MISVNWKLVKKLTASSSWTTSYLLLILHFFQ